MSLFAGRLTALSALLHSAPYSLTCYLDNAVEGYRALRALPVIRWRSCRLLAGEPLVRLGSRFSPG